MQILQSVFFYLTIGLLIVGAHQTFTVGFYESYWLFMMSLVSFFIFNFIKKKLDAPETSDKVKKKGKQRKKRK